MLMAMLVVVLVAAVAAASAWRQWTALEVEKAERDRSQAIWLLDGALDWVRLVLMLNVEKSNHVYYGQGWDTPLKESRLSTFLAVDKDNTPDTEDEELTEAFLSGQIADLHARFNLQNVVSESGKPNTQAIQQARRLFNTLKIPDADKELALLVSKLEQADSMLDTSLTSGKSLPAKEKIKPLRPVRLAQLRWFGLQSKTVDVLEKCRCVNWIDANAQDVKVNLNTAGDAVLAAVLDITPSQVEEIKEERKRKAFKTLAEVGSRVPSVQPKIQNIESVVGVDSRYFQILGSLRVNDINIQQVAEVRLINKRSRLSEVLSRDNKAVGSFENVGSQEAITEENFAKRYLDATQ